MPALHERVRKIWINGVNDHLLRLWKKDLDEKVDPKVRWAAEGAADDLYSWDGTTLPLCETVRKWADHEGIEQDAVVAYLASLGLALLVASKREA